MWSSEHKLNFIYSVVIMSLGIEQWFRKPRFYMYSLEGLS